jgi:4-aminobutyrate aminotransferase-like enzyme
MMPARANAILPPYCYRCPVNLEYPSCDVKCLETSEELMEHLTTKSVAGVLAETILVPGGMIVPPQEWLPRLKALAHRWGALLMLDEMQLAPARTGKMWAFEHTGVVPDIVTWGKGMSAGLAICGTVTTKAIADEVSGDLGLPWSGTYPGDPMPCAVALKSLQIVMRERLEQRSAMLGVWLRERLESIRDQYECIGDVRGMGLYQMLDIVTDKQTKTPDPAMGERIRYNAMLEGAAFICVKNFMRVCPPLIITQAELEDAIGRLEIAIKRSLDGLPKDIDFSSSSSLAETRKEILAAGRSGRPSDVPAP